MSFPNWQQCRKQSRNTLIIGLWLIVAMVAIINIIALKPYWPQSTTSQSAITTARSSPNLAQYHLMGKPIASSQQLPPLMLHLVLQGTITGTPGLALINDGTHTQLYHKGDSLPGGGVITQVLSDHVVVRYQNQLHSLKLPRKTLTPTSLNK